MLTFLRGHGLGNDYLVKELGPPLTPTAVVQICDRHTGVGSDGILEPIDPGPADYGVQIWNPDGSIAEKSGNGLRIFAQWLHTTQGAADSFSVFTGFDTVRCTMEATGVRVQMGRARCRNHTLLLGDQSLSVTVVDVGNPHCVVFLEGALDEAPWRAWGASIEVHPDFPNRTNVQFARLAEGRVVDARIWERGAGETSASGSSSCAVAAASVFTGQLEVGAVEVRMPGGTLEVEVRSDGEVVLFGPVELVCRVELLEGFEARVWENPLGGRRG